MNTLIKLLPHHEPVVYLFIALVIYQVVVKGDSLSHDAFQYIFEALGAMLLRSTVTPISKIPKNGSEVGSK